MAEEPEDVFDITGSRAGGIEELVLKK